MSKYRGKENADMMITVVLLAIVIRIIVGIIVIDGNAYLRYALSWRIGIMICSRNEERLQEPYSIAL